jgi:hypothetical protein
MLWQDYGIGFILPAMVSSVHQDQMAFKAEGASLRMQIHPLDWDTIQPDDGKDALAGYARDLGFRDIQGAQEIPFQDMLVFTVDTREKDESPLLCFLLQNTLSGQVFFGTINYGTDTNRPVAMAVIESFYAYE